MKLACKDLSDTECNFVAEGETPEATAKVMLDHARKNHTKDIEQMSDDQVMEAFSAKVHD